MSGKYNNFEYYFDNLQNEVNEFIRNKNSFKQKLRDFVFSFQMIDFRIQKVLFIARAFYLDQRDYYKQKIKILRREKSRNEQTWIRLTNELKKIKTPKLNNEALTEIEFLKNSIKDIKFKISNLNYQLENQNLDINAENKITEELVILEDEAKINVNQLLQLEKNQERKFQSSKFYNTKKKIDTLELKLTENYSNLKKWSARLLFSHKKMFALYKAARKFDIIKSKIAVILSDNKEVSVYYNQLYMDLLNENYNNMLEDLSQLKKRKKPRVVKEKEVQNKKEFIRKRKYSKKIIERKLNQALEKQKLGKKLDFYELKLILDHSKKSK
ncbi:MAG: hypothetical protein ACFFCV_01340 [Promethearchaeota archaeon]